MSIERYLSLREVLGNDAYIMPVLQGQESADYVRHLTQLNRELYEGQWVGVGSVCKRQGSPDKIAAILSAILTVRPDLKLHGFGVKQTALESYTVRSLLHSVDSMAWSYAARRQGRDANSIAEAIRWAQKVEHLLRS